MAYEAERQTAYDDIAAAGVLGAIRRDGVDYPCSFLLLSYSADKVDGDLIRKDDVLMMAPALGLPFDVDGETDTVVITDADSSKANGEWTIIDPSPFQPGGVIIYYDLQCRK